METGRLKMQLPATFFITAVVAVVSAAALTACASESRPERVAYRTLYGPDGAPQLPAFKAALESRFPPGSSMQLLTEYFSKIEHGYCFKSKEDATWRCQAEIVACVDVVRATVQVAGDTIENIVVSFDGLICN
jgi:hypothetical protein